MTDSIRQHLWQSKFTYIALAALLILATCGKRIAYAQHPRIAKSQVDRIVICDDLDPTKRPCNEPVIPRFNDADKFVEWFVREHRLENSEVRDALAAAAELGYRVGHRDGWKKGVDSRR